MSRGPAHATSIHLHIGGIAVDARALSEGEAPHAIEHRVRSALLARLAGECREAPPRDWVDAIARQILQAIPSSRERGSP